MILWKRLYWMGEYLGRDHEACREGNGKIALARGLDIPQMRLGDEHRIVFCTELPCMPLRPDEDIPGA